MSGTVSADDLEEASDVIIRHVQRQKYSDELDSLLRTGGVMKSSTLKSLTPMLNDQGLLCVGGRLSKSSLEDSSKHPCIIPYDHAIAKLIVKAYHNRAHLGTDWLISLLREKFWIVKLRNLVKQVKRECVVCKRLYSDPEFQKMSDLPSERTEPGHPPFTFVGMDCFGPIKVKRGRSEIKRYGCIFTCFCTRAIHLEMLSGLDTDSFLNGLRRFVARRGQPSKIWSDNGTNFVGALKEIKKSIKELNRAQVQSYCANNEIEFKFIPPSAPHMGGLWERIVRVVKRVLNAIAGSKVSLMIY